MAGELSKVDLLFIVLLGCHLRLLPWLWLEELMEGWENDWDHWESVSFQWLWSSGKSHTRSCSVFRAIFCPVIEERIMDIRWPLCRYALANASEKLSSLSESCLLLTGIIEGWLLKLTPICMVRQSRWSPAGVWIENERSWCDTRHHISAMKPWSDLNVTASMNI